MVYKGSTLRTWIVFCVIACIFMQGDAASNKYATKLIDDLFLSYKKDIRPVNNTVDSIHVDFQVFLFQILELDEKNQILTAYLWIRQEWHDAHLSWTPSKYDGLETIRIPSAKIWLPDIVLYNNADEKFTKNLQTNVILKSSGLVRWDQPAITKTSCEMDVVYFPFDIQSCHFTFGSWTFYLAEMNISQTQEEGNRDDFLENVEWEIVSMPIKRTVQKYSCCPDPYPIIEITLNLQRKFMFYIFNLLLPCVFISILAPLIFYLPAESGEKVSLGVTTLLAMTVFQLLVAENMPPSQAVPLIGKYYITTMALMSLSTATTIFVQNIHFCGSNPRPVPRWVKVWILHRLAKFLSIKINPRENEPPEKTFKTKTLNTQGACIASKHSKSNETFANDYLKTNGIELSRRLQEVVNGCATFPRNNSQNHQITLRNFDDLPRPNPIVKTVSNSSHVEPEFARQSAVTNPYKINSRPYSHEYKPRNNYTRNNCRETLIDCSSFVNSQGAKESVKEESEQSGPSLVKLNSSPRETLASLRRKKFHQMSMCSKSLDLTDDIKTPLLGRKQADVDYRGKYVTLNRIITEQSDQDRRKSIPQISPSPIHNSNNSVNLGESRSVTSLIQNDSGQYLKENTVPRWCNMATEATTNRQTTSCVKRVSADHTNKSEDKKPSSRHYGVTPTFDGKQNKRCENNEFTGCDGVKDEIESLDTLSISENIRTIAQYVTKQRKILDTVDEWKNVSRVCDRALMWIFIITQILFSTLIICKIL